jgi:DNA polymerase bacteriophage-type
VLKPGTEEWLPHGVAARMKGGVLALRKPNGVKLSYHGMRMVDGGLVFDGVNGVTKKWGTERTYGGRLVENLVQSVARDVMAEAILMTAPRLLPLMTVHDEIVWEVPEGEADALAHALQTCVETVPVWAAGLPLASDVKILRRYGK